MRFVFSTSWWAQSPLITLHGGRMGWRGIIKSRIIFLFGIKYENSLLKKIALLRKSMLYSFGKNHPRNLVFLTYRRKEYWKTNFKANKVRAIEYHCQNWGINKLCPVRPLFLISTCFAASLCILSHSVPLLCRYFLKSESWLLMQDSCRGLCPLSLSLNIIWWFSLRISLQGQPVRQAKQTQTRLIDCLYSYILASEVIVGCKNMHTHKKIHGYFRVYNFSTRLSVREL